MPSEETMPLFMGLLTVGAVYALVVVAVTADTYFRLRCPRPVRCPQTGGSEVIRLAAGRGTIAYLFGYTHLEIARCPRWTCERRDCDQECLRNAALDQSAG